MWEKLGLNYLENCDSLHLSLVKFTEELGKLLVYACKDFFLSRAATEQGMMGSLLSLSGGAPQVTVKS